MAYQKQTWRDYDDNKTEVVNMNQGAVVTPERLNHMETGIANSADKAEVTAQLQQTEQSLNAQLADKPNRTEVIAKSEGVGLNNLKADLLAAIQNKEGETTFNLLSTPRPRSVTPSSTTFLKTSSNLFNKNDVTLGKVITETGVVSDNVNYGYSHKIDVLPNQTFYSNGVYSVAYYDENDIFISRDDAVYSGGFFTTPPNCYMMRVNFNTVYIAWWEGVVQVSPGDVFIPFEPYQITLDDNIGVSRVKSKSVSRDMIADKAISHSQTDFIQSTTNLFDKDSLVYGKVIGSDGTIADHEAYAYSSPITFAPERGLVMTHISYVAYYDSDDLFIRRDEITTPKQTSYVGNPPADARMLRTCLNVAHPDTNIKLAQINNANELLPFEEFGLKLSEKIHVHSRKEDENFVLQDKYIINGEIDGVYSSPTIDGMTGINDIGYFTAEDIYSLFDELVTDYPDIVTKTLLGKDESGIEDIYRYDFNTPEILSERHPEKKPKLFLVGGVHGYEKAHPVVLYYMMKQMLENWKTEPLLETLKYNVHFITIPVVNPHSWHLTSEAIGSRYNANGVDIARNFEVGWQTADVNTRGAYPLSELEAQYIDTILKEEQENMIFLSSLHNFRSDTNNANDFIWQAASTQLQLHVGKSLVSRMTRKWKQEYSWTIDDETTLYGYSDMGAPPGSEGLQATKYGIQGSTFETSRRFTAVPDAIDYDTTALTLGTETLVNYVLLNLKACVEFYNKQ